MLSREPASEKAAEFVNVSNHSFLISRPQAVRELNQAWDRILFLGPRAALPFISDSVNRLSPKQNLIKIPVRSELQPTFFLSLSPLLPQSPGMPVWAPLRESRLSVGLCASAVLAGRPQGETPLAEYSRNALDAGPPPGTRVPQSGKAPAQWLAGCSPFCFLVFPLFFGREA